ncbi:Uncharacterised protein [Mycobacterium tuberculosis]|uniref:Uncharacterized protein n=1 Tax=Mycobacterium tuberculosis TaxID=1773 RepID=A0A654U774_MYCTX|nr:Uncharacterised protein [Mycobacterium tuberculosis]
MRNTASLTPNRSEIAAIPERSSLNTGPSNGGAPYPVPVRSRFTAALLRLAGSEPVNPGTCR